MHIPVNSADDDSCIIWLPLNRKPQPHSLSKCTRPSSDFKDFLLGSSVKWFMRPPHLKAGRTRPYGKKMTKGTLPKIASVEERVIREVYPITLGHMVSDMQLTRGRELDKCYDEFRVKLKLKQENYFKQSSPSVLSTYSDNILSDDFVDSSYVSDSQESHENELNGKNERKNKLGEMRLSSTKANLPDMRSELTLSVGSRCSRSNSTTSLATRSMRSVSTASPGLLSPTSSNSYVPSPETGRDCHLHSLSNVPTSPAGSYQLPPLPQSPYHCQLSRLKLEFLKMQEMELIQQRRIMELERLRPPKSKWYEMKDTGFHDEAHRNNMMVRNEQHLPQIQQRRQQVWTALTRAE